MSQEANHLIESLLRTQQQQNIQLILSLRIYILNAFRAFVICIIIAVGILTMQLISLNSKMNKLIIKILEKKSDL